MFPDQNLLLICVRKRQFVIFDVFMVATLKTAVFWNVAPCSMEELYCRHHHRHRHQGVWWTQQNPVQCRKACTRQHFFFIETVMIMSRKWNFIKVAYTNYDWRGSFQVSIHDIIKEILHETCTYSYIYTSRICLESCVHAEETLHIWGLSQKCHITQQNTLFIRCAEVIVIFEGPRTWKLVTTAARGNILTGNEILKALRRS